MNDDRIVAYSLLAHINDHDGGIRDLSDILIPLAKSSLSKLVAEENIHEGQLSDLHTRIRKDSGLNIPIPLVGMLLTRIATEQNRLEHNSIIIHTDYSFIIRQFSLTDYADVISDREKEVRSVVTHFEDFLRSIDLDPASELSLFEYLDANRVQLANTFEASDPTPITDLQFQCHAEFIIQSREDPPLYNSIRKIYLGSLLASYFELDLSSSVASASAIEFVLDTNLLISLLQLHSEDSYHTCKYLVDIAKNQGHRLTVLNSTLEETGNLLLNTADYWDGSFLESANPRSIYAACNRNGWTKTDLQRKAGSLKALLGDFDITFVYDITKYENMARASSEYDEYLNRGFNKEGALHDVIAIKYVQEKRKHLVQKYEKSKCWFVTHPRGRLTHVVRPPKGFLPETIRAEDMVSLLWLSSPGTGRASFKDIGLTQLVSSTLTSNFPEFRALRELEYCIAKYAAKDISEFEVVRISRAIADRTFKNVSGLVETAESDPARFIEQLRSISKKVQQLENQRKQEEVEARERLRAEHERQTTIALAEKERFLTDKYQTLLSEERSKHENRVNATKQNHDSQLTAERYNALSPVVELLNSSAKYFATSILVMITVISLGIGIIIVFIVLTNDWNSVEPFMFLMFGIPFILYCIPVIYFFVSKKELSVKPKVLWHSLYEARLSSLLAKHKISDDVYEAIKETDTASG